MLKKAKRAKASARLTVSAINELMKQLDTRTEWIQGITATLLDSRRKFEALHENIMPVLRQIQATQGAILVALRHPRTHVVRIDAGEETEALQRAAHREHICHGE